MQRAFLLHALSPLHAGTGHSADVIDLPIARMKATGIPIAPSSSIEGKLRDARRREAERSNASGSLAKLERCSARRPTAPRSTLARSSSATRGCWHFPSRASRVRSPG